MGTLNVFLAMRSLRMTWPDESIRCSRYRSNKNYCDCFYYVTREVQTYTAMEVHHVRGLFLGNGNT